LAAKSVRGLAILSRRAAGSAAQGAAQGEDHALAGDALGERRDRISAAPVRTGIRVLGNAAKPVVGRVSTHADPDSHRAIR
jgi:hypothetical protein